MTAWVLDLDGVIWLGENPIPGSAEAIGLLRDHGHEVAFCTNNSSQRVDAYERKLASFGIDASGAVITSAMAAAMLVEPDERVLACAGAGVLEAMERRGTRIVDRDLVVPGGEPVVDVVVVGFHPTFDYASMAAATTAVLGGARLVATNDDPIYPAADGPAPGCGAILASIERATGRTAEIAGKPNQPMADLLTARFGSDSVFVGDSLGTDGEMARRLGWQFGLVLSGNSRTDQVPTDQPAEWVAEDLSALVDRMLGGDGSR